MAVEREATVAVGSWRAEVVALMASMFLASFSGLYVPLLPSYVEELGGPPYIATAVVMAIPQMVAAAIVVPLGLYVDRSGRRVEAMALAMALGIAAHLLLTVRSLPALIASRALAGVLFFASTPIATSIYAIIVPRHRLGTVLALASGTIALAGGFPQIASGFMYRVFGGYNALFYLAAASNAMALAIAVPVYARIWSATRVRMENLRPFDVLWVLRLRTVFWLTVGHMVYSVGWNLVFPASPYVMENVFGAPKEVVTAVFGIASVALGLGQYLWGPAIDRWGGRRVMLVAFLLTATVTLLMAFAHSLLPMYAALMVLFAVFTGAIPPSVSYISSKSVERELVSLAVSIPWVFAYLAGVGSFAAGAMVSSLGLETTLLASIVLQMLGLAISLRIPKGV